jgi:hypothetical protein
LNYIEDIESLENLVNGKLELRKFNLRVNWKTTSELFEDVDPVFAEWLRVAHKKKLRLQGKINWLLD